MASTTFPSSTVSSAPSSPLPALTSSRASASPPSRKGRGGSGRIDAREEESDGEDGEGTESDVDDEEEADISKAAVNVFEVRDLHFAGLLAFFVLLGRGEAGRRHRGIIAYLCCMLCSVLDVTPTD